MLGRLRMSVREALDMYATLSEEIFGQPQSFRLLPYRTKFTKVGVEDAVKKVVHRRTPPDFHGTGTTVFSQLPSPPDLCKVFVIQGNIF